MGFAILSLDERQISTPLVGNCHLAVEIEGLGEISIWEGNLYGVVRFGCMKTASSGEIHPRTGSEVNVSDSGM